MQVRRLCLTDCTDPKIHQTTRQMGSVNPRRHLSVMFFRYQKRQAEIMQHSLNGPFPRPMFFTHLKQFTDKRHKLFRQPNRQAQ